MSWFAKFAIIFLAFVSTVSIAHAATIEVYVLVYDGHTISLATDMAEFECEKLKNEIQDIGTDELSCVRVEVRRELI